MTLEECLHKSVKRLLAVHIQSASLDASLLLCHALGLSKIQLITENERVLTAKEEDAVDGLVERREKGEPVAYILGHKEFWGMDFKVAPGILIPRPDTETLIASMTTFIPNKKAQATFADLGVGSGAIVISLLKEFPNFKAYGVDMNEKALEITLENAKANGVADRLTLIKGSWADKIPEKLNFVVSNPPYITSEEMDELMVDVKDYEPHDALHGGDDGMDCYRQIEASVKGKLIDGGLLVMELAPKLRIPMEELLKKPDWAQVQFFKDLSGKDRIVAALKM